MPVEVYWLNTDQTVLMNKYVGDYTLADYYQAVRENVALIESLPHAITVIMDATEGRSRVDRVLSAASYTSRNPLLNVERTIMVNAPLFIKSAISAMMTAAPKNAPRPIFVNTLAQAYELLQLDPQTVLSRPNPNP